MVAAVWVERAEQVCGASCLGGADLAVNHEGLLKQGTCGRAVTGSQQALGLAGEGIGLVESAAAVAGEGEGGREIGVRVACGGVVEGEIAQCVVGFGLAVDVVDLGEQAERLNEVCSGEVVLATQVVDDAGIQVRVGLPEHAADVGV